MPALSACRRLDHLAVWNVGGIDDALALALVCRHLGSRAFRVFRTGPPLARRPLEWSFSDLRGAPRTPWIVPVEERRGRWAPARDLMESVVLGTPTEPVDLLVLGDAPDPAARPWDRVRRGGHVFLARPGPDRAGLAPDLLPADRTGRLFCKATPAVTASPVPRPGPAMTLARFDHEARLVDSYLVLARSLARRFRNRGERAEDLEQVAVLALIRAAGRFSEDRGAFGPFATTSVLGELKRHFRDRMWTVRVPRPVQEMHLAVRSARDELAQTMQASPGISDIARYLQTTEETVLAAMEAGDNFWPVSLDAPRRADEDPGTEVPVFDAGFDQALDLRRLRDALPALSPTERLVVRRLYFDGQSQRQVAAEIGASQMQVSRMMAKVLAKLRDSLESA